MSTHIDIEQGEDPGIPPSVLSGRDNVAGVPVVGPAAAPGMKDVTDEVGAGVLERLG